jgi:SHS2 domain-containing protein
MTEPHWEHYSHPADMGIRGFGRTREEAYAQAALALTAIITDPAKIEPRKSVEIICEEDDDEMLFWYWLSALLYEMDTRTMLFGRFDVAPVDGGIRATAWGDMVDVTRHQPAVEVKAATYADLKVERDSRGMWVAQCIVDV